MEQHNTFRYVSTGEAIKLHFKQLFVFSGRTTRAEFWSAQIPYAILFVLPIPLALIGYIFALNFETLNLDYNGQLKAAAGIGIYFVALIVMPVVLGFIYTLFMLGISARRLNDAGIPPAFTLLHLAGLGFVVLIMCCIPSDTNPRPNELMSPINPYQQLP